MQKYLLVGAVLLVCGGFVLIRSGQRMRWSDGRTADSLAAVPTTRDRNRNDALIEATSAEKAPALSGENWTNSEPLALDQLSGRVVLLEFWTFDCYNCRNSLPAIKALAKKYQPTEVTVIGVHTPELDQEREWPNVTAAVKELGITYPVVSDNAYDIWNAYGVQAWPTVVIIDRKGRIRFRHIGEGAYDLEDQVVQKLLSEKD
jgi:thiol-disulfide isomerase/thioredoxin